MSTAPRASMVQLTAPPNQPVRPRTRLRPGCADSAHCTVDDRRFELRSRPTVRTVVTADVRPDTAVGAAPSAAETKRTPMSWRMDSARMFHRFQTERRLTTSISTTAAMSTTRSTATSSARNGASDAPRESRCCAQVVASSPSRAVAHVRHFLVRSASECSPFSDRVSRVACCRNRATAAAEGSRPCSATYSATRRFLVASMPSTLPEPVVLWETSALNSAGTPSISHPVSRSLPRSTGIQETPRNLAV